ncbi:MAG: glutathione S-transferase N-terminal domain-containing protein, partial [Alphaproteobacteria bacterium]|nr:glutathione S-transferase N-terminal domain-containing protein [Alphaproteobacteria bacterium]
LAGLDLDVAEVDYKAPDYLAINPLGKVPALQRDDGSLMIDSSVIAQIVAAAGDEAKVYPADREARWQAQGLEALADGVIDAAILAWLEIKRPDGERSSAWEQKQLGKMQAGLDAIERQAAGFTGRTDIGVLAVLACVGWIDLRGVGEDWRTNRPNLTAWVDSVSNEPFVTRTAPPAG